MGETVLITGGAGFIGSHLADELLESGYRVRILDSLTPQVHGEFRQRPKYLSDEVELVTGDVREAAALQTALAGVENVVHLAAAVGVGQSAYQMAHYTSVNDLGTALLLEALMAHPVKRLVVASSMSIYGEGLYRNAEGRTVSVPERTREQLERGDWEHRDAGGNLLEPIPTPETKVVEPSSVYALSKYVQERMCLLFGEAYQVPTVALRFFNVYGPRQALSNPYTGVLAIFASRFLNGEPPLIFEDGYQRRDFVNVHDVARACRLALETPSAPSQVFNIGSGSAVTIREIAERMADVLHRTDLEPEITGRFRVGDIRHCYADIAEARRVLGYEPQVEFEEGLMELAEWLASEEHEAVDGTGQARQELLTRGLIV